MKTIQVQSIYKRINRLVHIDVISFHLRKGAGWGFRVDYVNTLKNPEDLFSKNAIQKFHDTHASHIMNGTMDCWFQDQGG